MIYVCFGFALLRFLKKVMPCHFLESIKRNGVYTYSLLTTMYTYSIAIEMDLKLLWLISKQATLPNISPLKR